MWYNKIVRVYGARRLVSSFTRHAAAIVAAACFLIATFFLNFFVLSTDLTGVPPQYVKRVRRVLNDNGIKSFTPFSSVDKAAIEKALLSFDGVSYSSCEKVGYSLKITVRCDENAGKRAVLSQKIVSECDGVVKSVSVYRGRALVSVGDAVKSGDTLCDGTITLPDGSTVNGYCLATVVIEKTITEEFLSDDNSSSTLAAMVARTRLNVFGESAQAFTETTASGDKFRIKVTLKTNVVYGD